MWERLGFGLIFSLVLFSSPGSAAEPQWIWGTKEANRDAPVGTCHFRKVFELGEPASGTIEIACDNRYVLRVNRRLAGASNRWQQMDRYDISRLLVRGKNVIDVRCVNDEQAAGMIARVTVQAKGSEPVDLSTDANWNVYLQVGRSWNPAAFASMKPTPAFALGTLEKTAPWAGGVTPSETVHQAGRASSADASPLELNDGDRVVLVGNTLIERAQKFGYLESALTARYHDRHVVFRNLGWSGDTVFGHARARFGTVDDGFRHLVEHVYALKPTVVLVAYGTNESFAGEAGLPEFVAGLEKLLDVLAASGARLVLVSPLRQEHLPPPLPDPAEQNRRLELYTQAMRDVGGKRGYPFVDLFTLLGREAKTSPASDDPLDQFTDNGIHLTGYGYWRAAPRFEQGLGLPPAAWNVSVDAAKASCDAEGTAISDLSATPRTVRFSALDQSLPLPPPPSDAPPGAADRGPRRLLRVENLAPGNYRLTIDGRAAADASAAAWSAGVAIQAGPPHTRAEQLRQLILKKNELYFHRWRPQNETYLYLFRKHEQGNNAREIPQFDPLIGQWEQKIAKARSPLPHTYQLTPLKEK